MRSAKEKASNGLRSMSDEDLLKHVDNCIDSSYRSCGECVCLYICQEVIRRYRLLLTKYNALLKEEEVMEDDRK